MKRIINDKLEASLQSERTRRIGRISFLITITVLIILSLSSRINVKENKEYTDFKYIVAYIYEFEDLPNNYIPKSNSGLVDGEDLFLYEPFMNNEGLLPLNSTYISAYYNSTKTNPGLERIVFSSSEIYYTNDHYESFNKVTRFEIYGFHFIILSCLWILLIGGGFITLIIIKKGYISIDIIKYDIKNDTHYVIEKVMSLYKKFKKIIHGKKRYEN